MKIVVMGRGKILDADKALKAASMAFQANGYHGTSIGQLVVAMEISRSTLYGIWVDKQTLYQHALELYAEAYQSFYAHWAGQKHTNPLGAINELLTLSANLEGYEAENGCFLHNASAELGNADKTVRQICQINLDFCIRCIEAVVKKGVNSASIRNDQEPDVLARLIYQQVIGMRLATSLGVPKETLLATVNALIISLKTQ
jgi:TetR/AcrR family transcriptional repressor of nem operon